MFIFPRHSDAQSIANCILIDSFTIEPVAYAFISAGSLSLHSGSDGKFSNEKVADDTCYVSKFGYQELLILPNEWKDTIWLNREKIIHLPEVTIIENPSLFEIGYHRFRTKGTAECGEENYLGVYIPHPQSSGLVANVFFVSRKNKAGINYNIKIFEATENKAPGKLLCDTNWISTHSRKFIQISVQDFYMFIPENGVIVAVGHGNKDTDDQNERMLEISFTDAINEARSSIFHLDVWAVNDVYETVGQNWNYKIGLELIRIDH